jgi:hypothetical protein
LDVDWLALLLLATAVDGDGEVDAAEEEDRDDHHYDHGVVVVVVFMAALADCV